MCVNFFAKINIFFFRNSFREHASASKTMNHPTADKKPPKLPGLLTPCAKKLFC